MTTDSLFPDPSGGIFVPHLPNSTIPSHPNPHAPRKPNKAQQRARTRHRIAVQQAKAAKARGEAQASPIGAMKGDKVLPSGAAAYLHATRILPEHGLRYPAKFKFFLLRADKSVAELTTVVGCSWDDVSAVVTGQLQVRESLLRVHEPLTKIHVGDQIVCGVDVHDGQGYQELWRMRTKTMSFEVDSATRTFDLANDLSLLEASEENWLFAAKTTKTTSAAGFAQKKPGGWRGDEIIKAVCNEFHVNVGYIYKGDWKIPKLYVKRGSPLEVIRVVLLKEWRHRRRRLIVKYEKGQLNIRELQRSSTLRALGPTLLSAVYKEDMLPEFASAVKLYGLKDLLPADTAKHPNKQKMVIYRTAPTSVSQFGFMQKILWSPDARNDATLKQEADSFLSLVAKPRRTLQLVSPGIPYLTRGDAITLGLGDDGLRRQVVWVNSISHTITPDQYISTINVIFDDPYVPHAEMLRIWKLKSTHDEAVGNRARLNPGGWYLLPPGNKGDGTQGKSLATAVFNSSGTAAAQIAADNKP